MNNDYLDYGLPVIVVLKEEPWGTCYKLRAYPFDMRDQFLFVSDMSSHGKARIAVLGAKAANVTPALSLDT